MGFPAIPGGSHDEVRNPRREESKHSRLLHMVEDTRQSEGARKQKPKRQ
jgi:hypothetical protein